MNEINNQSSIDYEYNIDPNEPAISASLDSNITSTDQVIGELSMVKTVDKEYATIGDILTYTVNINNNGNVLVSNVVFTDIIPTGATFVPGSVTVDGTPQPTYNPNTGFSLGNMIILSSRVVTFKVEVTSVPSPNTIINQAETDYNYLVIIPIAGSSESNTVTTIINFSEVELVKTASPEAVKSGDTLTYTSVITNNGNVPINDIFFQDILPSEVSFVTGSVIVNGNPEVGFNPNIGFVVPNVLPTGTCTIVFETTVN